VQPRAGVWRWRAPLPGAIRSSSFTIWKRRFFSGWRGGAACPSPRDSDGFSSLVGSIGNVLSIKSGLRDHRKIIIPGAQTERRGDAGPVRNLLGGKAAPADSFFFRIVSSRQRNYAFPELIRLDGCSDFVECRAQGKRLRLGRRYWIRLGKGIINCLL